MGTFSFWHILLILMLFMLLFGRGKISDLMGDVAKGIKSFKKGMADEEPTPPRTIGPGEQAGSPKMKEPAEH